MRLPFLAKRVIVDRERKERYYRHMNSLQRLYEKESRVGDVVSSVEQMIEFQHQNRHLMNKYKQEMQKKQILSENKKLLTTLIQINEESPHNRSLSHFQGNSAISLPQPSSKYFLRRTIQNDILDQNYLLANKLITLTSLYPKKSLDYEYREHKKRVTLRSNYQPELQFQPYMSHNSPKTSSPFFRDTLKGRKSINLTQGNLSNPSLYTTNLTHQKTDGVQQLYSQEESELNQDNKFQANSAHNISIRSNYPDQTNEEYIRQQKNSTHNLLQNIRSQSITHPKIYNTQLRSTMIYPLKIKLNNDPPNPKQKSIQNQEPSFPKPFQKLKYRSITHDYIAPQDKSYSRETPNKGQWTNKGYSPNKGQKRSSPNKRQSPNKESSPNKGSSTNKRSSPNKEYSPNKGYSSSKQLYQQEMQQKQEKQDQNLHRKQEKQLEKQKIQTQQLKIQQYLQQQEEHEEQLRYHQQQEERKQKERQMNKLEKQTDKIKQSNHPPRRASKKSVNDISNTYQNKMIIVPPAIQRKYLKRKMIHTERSPSPEQEINTPKNLNDSFLEAQIRQINKQVLDLSSQLENNEDVSTEKYKTQQLTSLKLRLEQIKVEILFLQKQQPEDSIPNNHSLNSSQDFTRKQSPPRKSSIIVN